MRGRDELAEGTGFANDRCELRTGGQQHPHIVGREGARIDGLHDQHTLQQAAIHQRHAEEGVIRIFTRLAEVLEPRMPHGVGDDERLELLGHQSGQPFCRPHAHMPDTLRP